MSHHLAWTDFQNPIPMRAVGGIPPADKATLWNILDLRTA
jgi:hypothetical protein